MDAQDHNLPLEADTAQAENAATETTAAALPAETFPETENTEEDPAPLTDEEFAGIVGHDPSAFEMLPPAFRAKLYDCLREKLFTPTYTSSYGGLRQKYEVTLKPHQLDDRQFGLLQFIGNILSFFIIDGSRLRDNGRIVFTEPTRRLFPHFHDEFGDTLRVFLREEKLDQLAEIAALPREDIKLHGAAAQEQAPDQAGTAETAEPAPVETAPASPETAAIAETPATPDTPGEDEARYEDALKLAAAAQADRSYYAQLTGIERQALSQRLDAALQGFPESADTRGHKTALSNLLARMIVEFGDERVPPMDRLEIILGNEGLLEDELYEIARHVRRSFPQGADIRRAARGEAAPPAPADSAWSIIKPPLKISMNVTFSPLEPEGP